MRRKMIMIGGLLALFVASFVARESLRPEPVEAAPLGPPRRIVSLAPSITEILFALGLGDRVVGVTRYCDFPAEALTKTQVGGLFDPNYEAIVGLKPDLLIVLEEHGQIRDYFSGKEQRLLVVNHKTVDDILASITTIGETCGVEQQADTLLASMRARMATVAAATKGSEQPRVMMVVSRESGAGALGQVYIAGEDGFYSSMLELVGARNAYEGDVAFPVISAEGILKLNPDVIIELAGDMEARGLDPQHLLADWKALPELKAVANDRVHVLTEDYLTVPGPRFVDIMELLAPLLHPATGETP